MKIASTLLLGLLFVLAGFSCAPAGEIIDESIRPKASGPPLRLSLNEVQPSSVKLAWTPPLYLGTKMGGRFLQESELIYRIYYLIGEVDDELPTAEGIKNLATAPASSQMIETATGATNIQIENLELGARYFFVVETHNSFAVVETEVEAGVETPSDSAVVTGTLSEDVQEVVLPLPFEGDLVYPKTEHELSVFDKNITISPVSVPTTTSGASGGASVRYVLEKTEGDFPSTTVNIIEETGAVTINSLIDPTVVGTARFVVRAEADSYFSQEILFTVNIAPLVSGAVTGLSIESTSIENNSFEVQWIAPREPGMKQGDSTSLKHEELVYRVYYLAVDTLPEVASLVQDARAMSQVEQVQGVTNVRLLGLNPGTRYFVAVDTYNPFTEVSTLSEDVVNAMTSTEVADLSGMLAYNQSEYSYPASSSAVTIDPSNEPTATGGASIEYGLYKRDGAQFADSSVTIDSITGMITVDPSSTMAVGTANYRVFTQVAGFNTQYVEIAIRITQIGLNVTPYYSQEATTVIPVPIGQAIWDSLYANNGVLLSIESSEFSNDPDNRYTVYLGNGSGVLSDSSGTRIMKRPNAENRILIKGVDLGDYNSRFEPSLTGANGELYAPEQKRENLSRSDGTLIGISGPGIAGVQEVAIYRPGEIRNWQDLQAMRVNQYGNYVLKNDIVFPDTEEGKSNFKSIGDGYLPFQGSLDGANGSGSFRIIGMKIENNKDYYLGLFRKIEGKGIEKVVVQNLVFVDCVVTGQDMVGTVAGVLSTGTIKNVGVELSVPGAGRVEGIPGDIPDNMPTGSNLGVPTGSHIGGLVGSVNQARVEGYVEVPVKGVTYVGGLVGFIYNGSSTVAGYVTGNVTGKQTVGGLVGASWFSDAAVNVMGYTTGDVTGDANVGGLVGHTFVEGKIKGYSTGNITGQSMVGGLVGYPLLAGTITGYSTGDVTGIENVGGLLGGINNAVVVGYTRSTVYRSEGLFNTFGKVLGGSCTSEEIMEGVRRRTYHSQGRAPESQLTDVSSGTEIEEPLLGLDGNPVDITGMHEIGLFSELFAPDSSGDWIWTGNGKWPALDLDGLISAADQPTN